MRWGLGKWSGRKYNVLLTLYKKNLLTINVRVYFWILKSTVDLSLSYSLDNYHFIVNFEINNWILQLFFFFNIVLAILDPSPFSNHKLLCVYKSCARILIDISLNIEISLKRTDIFTMLSLPIHEHDLSFHLFRSSLIYFIDTL